MKSVKVMLGNEVRVYSAPDNIQSGHIVVIEGPSGFVTAMALETGPEVADAYPIAAHFNFDDYALKVERVNRKIAKRNQLSADVQRAVAVMTEEELLARFPEIAEKSK